jgi:hypothetical protein
MPGLCNLGAKEQRFRRGKAMLRIPGSDLQAYLDDYKALLSICTDFVHRPAEAANFASLLADNSLRMTGKLQQLTCSQRLKKTAT